MFFVICLVTHDDMIIDNYLLMQQNGYPGRRRSLVDDARFETKLNRDSRDEGKLSQGLYRWIKSLQMFRFFLFLLPRLEDLLPEEEVFVTDETVPAATENGTVNVHLILGMRDNMDSLGRSLKTIQVSSTWII